MAKKKNNIPVGKTCRYKSKKSGRCVKLKSSPASKPFVGASVKHLPAALGLPIPTFVDTLTPGGTAHPPPQSATVYVVMGSCGRYDDYQDWVVAVRADAYAARDHVALAQQRADEWRAMSENARNAETGVYGSPPPGWNPYDRHMECDGGTQTTYAVVEVPFYGKLPAMPELPPALAPAPAPVKPAARKKGGKKPAPAPISSGMSKRFANLDLED